MPDNLTRSQERGTIGRSSAPGDSTLPAVRRLKSLRANASDAPKARALTFGGRSLSYQDLDLAVDRRATALARLGLVPGDRLAILLPASPASVIYDLAAQAAHLAAVPLDPLATPGAMTTAIRGARILITSDDVRLFAMATALLAGGAFERIVVVTKTSNVSATTAIKLRLGGSLASVSSTPHSAVIRENVFLRDAGSSSGHAAPAHGLMPDEIARSQAAKSANVEQVLAALPPLAHYSERILAAVPLCDPLALTIASGLAIARGAELIIPHSLTPDGVARALYDHAPTLILASMARLAGLLESPSVTSRSFRDLKATLTFGPPYGEATPAAFAALTRAPIVETYGSRAVAAVTVTQAGAAAAVSRAFGPLTGTRFTVRDLADPAREVPRGERGTLHVTGPQFAAAGADGSMAADSGAASVATGDVGLIDAQGDVVVICPQAELVVAAGYMIYPSRIEAALLEHPGVAGAAVLGISDGRRGMAPKAFVLLKPGVALTERDLAKHLASRISKIETPADIDFCSELPRDSFASVDKAALRAQMSPRL